MYKTVRGTNDILPPEVFLWQQIEEKARQILSNYGYQEIRTPLIEEEGLFSRSLGNSSEVVNKQMFLVKRAVSEGRDRPIVLRPEGTAGVVRAYLENNLHKKKALAKFFYMGAMFRAERPQKGRLRQFHHLGVEAIGSDSAYLDVELIMLTKHLLEAFGIDRYRIEINSLGCIEDKKRFTLFIKDILKDRIGDFCKDCQRRYLENVLRILDCKNRVCRDILKDLKIKQDYLCSDCQDHFNKVVSGLDTLNIEYKISPLLVRGLDYYTRTVFEITHPDLGTQDALGAGGRYDNLVEDLGGIPTGACGFALGVERILLVKKKDIPEREVLVYLISLGEEARIESLKILNSLRKNNISIDTDYQSRSLKANLRYANALKVRFVLILGERELKTKTLQIKDMHSGTQRSIPLETFINNPLEFIC